MCPSMQTLGAESSRYEQESRHRAQCSDLERGNPLFTAVRITSLWRGVVDTASKPRKVLRCSRDVTYFCYFLLGSTHEKLKGEKNEPSPFP